MWPTQRWREAACPAPSVRRFRSVEPRDTRECPIQAGGAHGIRPLEHAGCVSADGAYGRDCCADPGHLDGAEADLAQPIRITPDERPFLSRRAIGRQVVRAAVSLVLLTGRAAHAETHATVGLGTGLPYGSPLAGAGVSAELGRHFAVLAGAGPGSRAIWAGGVRLHVRPPEAKWRPHISVLGWPEGYGIYAGTDHDVGRRGGWFLTYGVGVGNVNLEAPAGILFGAGYRF